MAIPDTRVNRMNKTDITSALTGYTVHKCSVGQIGGKARSPKMKACRSDRIQREK